MWLIRIARTSEHTCNAVEIDNLMSGSQSYPSAARFSLSAIARPMPFG